MRLSIHAHRWEESGNVQGIATVLKNMYPEFLISWGRVGFERSRVDRATDRSIVQIPNPMRTREAVRAMRARGWRCRTRRTRACSRRSRPVGEARGPIQRQLELVCREDEVLGAGLQRAASRPGHSAVARDLQAPGANPKHPSHLGLIAYRESGTPRWTERHAAICYRKDERYQHVRVL